MLSWLFEYSVTPVGLEIRLFRRIPIYRLGRRDVLKVRAIDGFFGAWKFGSRPWNTASLGNRSRLRWVLIEKPRGIRFLAVSSDDPIAFAQALDVQR